MILSHKTNVESVASFKEMNDGMQNKQQYKWEDA